MVQPCLTYIGASEEVTIFSGSPLVYISAKETGAEEDGDGIVDRVRIERTLRANECYEQNEEHTFMLPKGNYTIIAYALFSYEEERVELKIEKHLSLK